MGSPIFLSLSSRTNSKKRCALGRRRSALANFSFRLHRDRLSSFRIDAYHDLVPAGTPCLSHAAVTRRAQAAKASQVVRVAAGPKRDDVIYLTGSHGEAS
jgi:hypothetical protein